MRARLRARLSYANVVSALTLFVALAGGTAYALNTVGSGDVINESLLSQDIKNREVATDDLGLGAVFGTRFRDNAILAAHVVDNTLTGSEFNGNAELTTTGTDAFVVSPVVAFATPLEDLTSQITSLSAGTHSVILPLNRPASLHGRDLDVEKVNYCFRTNDAANLLTRVELQRTYGGPTALVAFDDTDRTNTSAQCFDLTPDSPVSTNEALLLKFDITYGSSGQNVFLGPARITLKPGS